MTLEIIVDKRPEGSLGARKAADYIKTTRRRLFKLRKKNIGPKYFREKASQELFYLKEDLDKYNAKSLHQVEMEFEDKQTGIDNVNP